MLQRVTMDGIELPRLYIAENEADAKLAMSKGIPFVRWKRGNDELIKMLLRPALEIMFPDIKWNKVLGRKKKFSTMVEICDGTGEDGDAVDSSANDMKTGNMVLEDGDEGLHEIADIADSERLFSAAEHGDNVVRKLNIEDYVGDMSSQVNLEVLQKLRLMPAFIGDMLDCIRTNVGNGVYWNEGYNKRLGLTVGRYDASRQKPNLIILDVSGSIPRGISATMILLVDTLRTQLSADLIITAASSRFYPMGSELPDPQDIRNQFGYGNEARQFFDILDKDIKGRHYGHVFSFGDNDTPDYYDHEDYSTTGTTVDFVHHYHTYIPRRTGYAKWCSELACEPKEEFDTSWCNVIVDH